MPAVQPSQYVEIIGAITAIATTQAGMTFPANAEYEMPDFPVIEEAGYPYFVVRFGRAAGWASGGEIRGGDVGMRGIGQVEPAWDFDIYALYSSADESNFGDAAHALVSLLTAFVAAPDLGLGGDITCTIVDPQLTYVTFAEGRCIAAKMAIRAYESLSVNY